MLKFVIISALLVVAYADIDKFLGRAVSIGISPNITELGTGCDWFTVTKVSEVHCTCDGRTNVPLISIKQESDKNSDARFAAVEIKSFAEVEQTVKTAKCECGDKEHAFLAIKEIDDNYYVVYSAPFTPNGLTLIVLNARTIPTQADLDKTVSGIPNLSGRTDYGVFCGLQ